jgi:hypothetical protein
MLKKSEWLPQLLSLFSKALIHLYFEQLDGDGGSRTNRLGMLLYQGLRGQLIFLTTFD